MPDTSDTTSRRDVDSVLNSLLSPGDKGEELPSPAPKKRVRCTRFFVLVLLLGIVSIFFLYLLSWRAPTDFPETILFSVSSGASLQKTGEQLVDARLVRSIFWFKAWSFVLGAEKDIKAGSYSFSKPVPVWTIVKRFSTGSSQLAVRRITIPEGSTIRQTASILKASLPMFNEQGFLALAKGKEGYLFPDTYSFAPGTPSETIIKTMEETLTAKLASISTDVDTFGKPLKDVLIMASLLEEEARTTETRRKIAGILWKRLEIGMPLQVDAVFPYILGKNTFEVTLEDLQTDSPYNTYKYAGLPPTPITNPGLDSILSAVTPIETPYLYYLSDKQGEMHYAVNHLQHLTNKEKYLR